MRAILFVVVVAAVAATPPLAAPPVAKTVVLTCRPGWRGTAVGQYGGVGFEVSCHNGRGNERLTGMVGTAYAMRVGVESSSVGGDCVYSGDAETVSERCIEVALSIQ